MVPSQTLILTLTLTLTMAPRWPRSKCHMLMVTTDIGHFIPDVGSHVWLFPRVPFVHNPPLVDLTIGADYNPCVCYTHHRLIPGLYAILCSSSLRLVPGLCVIPCSTFLRLVTSLHYVCHGHTLCRCQPEVACWTCTLLDAGLICI